MFKLGNLLGLFKGNAYRWEEFNLSQARRASGGAGATRNLKGRHKSIYHKWGFNNDAYHVHLSKQERAGKTWQETQAMRMKIWKNRSKAV